jgi:cyanate lyase
MSEVFTLNDGIVAELNLVLDASALTWSEFAAIVGLDDIELGMLLWGQADVTLDMFAVFAEVLGFDQRSMVERAEKRVVDAGIAGMGG